MGIAIGLSAPSAHAGGADVRKKNVRLKVNNSLFGGTVLDVLAKLFPSGEVEAKVRVRYEGQRVTDIQVKVYGKVVLKHSDIAIPLKLLEGFLRHELEVSELSLTEKCEGLRDFLSYIRDRVTSPHRKAVVSGWISAIPVANQIRAGEGHWYLHRVHENAYRSAVVALHSSAPALELDLNELKEEYRLQTRDFLGVIEPANLVTRKILKQMGAHLYSSNFLALAEAVYDLGGTLRLEAQIDTPIPANYRNPVGLGVVTLKLDVDVPGETFSLQSRSEFNLSRWNLKNPIEDPSWIEPAAEHLGETIAATPLALPLIQDSRIFEPNFNCMGMLEPADPEDY